MKARNSQFRVVSVAKCGHLVITQLNACCCFFNSLSIFFFPTIDSSTSFALLKINSLTFCVIIYLFILFHSQSCSLEEQNSLGLYCTAVMIVILQVICFYMMRLHYLALMIILEHFCNSINGKGDEDKKLR